jgi:hypothetical protein
VQRIGQVFDSAGAEVEDKAAIAAAMFVRSLVILPRVADQDETGRQHFGPFTSANAEHTRANDADRNALELLGLGSIVATRRAVVLAHADQPVFRRALPGRGDIVV